MDDVRCTGSEIHIEDCPHTDFANCGQYGGAGVVCTGNVCYFVCYIYIRTYILYSHKYKFINSTNSTLDENVTITTTQPTITEPTNPSETSTAFTGNEIM